MKIIFIIVSSVLFICILFSIITLCNNYLYNAVFNRKERKLWKFVIRHVDKFEYVCTNELGTKFTWKDYVIYVWNDNTCSIHIDTPTRRECLGTHADEVMSNKMKCLLLAKIE